MFDDHWIINCRSQISAGKSNVKALYFWSTKNISEKTDVPILSEDGLSQKGRLRWARRGPHHPWARGPPWPRPSQVWCPWPTSGAPPSRTSSPRNPKTRGVREKIFRRLHEAETTEREKLSGREKSAGEIPSRRGEIIAILIVIALDFIGIIIIIISTAITTITAAPSRSAVTSRAILCLVHRGNSPGVNYSLWLMLLSFIGELKYMFRSLSIIISPLIMIHMMSRE
jgi:hypothetical protein